ncbi:Vanillate O-demethylase oxygenase subunit [Lysobacter capsici AZ78]|uniref:Vanillate O-demethylase oxygenase subunit n=1 Tax=Lysobacter capsici AZ78 TaxID=1444315 RepID=A0A108U7Y4_9GAMM|nr:Rieske 2Fe-2S domain-containing protein [Lysobacter capsici]KWS04226.1 Vanillate O-demethylase oxygenase subunit [Lysobacter capsici AZ78]
MTTWHASHYARWFPALCTDRLGHKPVAVTVLDRPIVLGRARDGRLFALEDRCPHRHAPLSAGTFTESGIACPYHGWRFDADGRLCEIPGMPADCPLPQVRVRNIAVREHDGLIWLRLDGRDEGALPRMLSENSPGSRRFLWQTQWQAHIVDAIENFLDPLHTHWIHPGLVRSGGERQPMTARFEPDDAGFKVIYRDQPRQSGLLYRLFESPRESEQAIFDAPGSAQIEYRYVNGGIVRISLHFTPQTRDITSVFASLHVENRWAPAWLVRRVVWPLLKRVNDQDARMLAMQSANLQRFPGVRGASTQLDLVRPWVETFWTTGEAPADAQAHEVRILL